MTSNYAPIIRSNLERLYDNLPSDLDLRLGADRVDNDFTFKAFGRRCRLTPDGIRLDGSPEIGPRGIVISLYALNAAPDKMQIEPLRAYKDFDGTMPYVGAFVAHAETPLVAHVEKIQAGQQNVFEHLDGRPAPTDLRGDLALLVRPLPKISLAYIFYFADEDFPASATCLFSNNADRFLPVDGLADLAEYTSRALLELTDPPSHR